MRVQLVVDGKCVIDTDDANVISYELHTSHPRLSSNEPQSIMFEALRTLP